MAIQMRRGNKADLDTTQLKPGEFAMPMDTGEVWAKVTSAEAKRLATLDATGRLEQYSGVPNYPPMHRTGSIIEEAAFSSPLYDLKIYGKTAETVTGTKSPDNPSTLNGVGGRGEVDVWVHGKNFVDVTETFPLTSAGLTVSYDTAAQVFTINGTSTGTPSFIITKRRMRLKEGDTYTISTTVLGGAVTYAGSETAVFRWEAKSVNYTILPTQFFMSTPVTSANTSRSRAITENAQNNAGSISMWFWSPAGAIFTNYKIKVQLERGSTATAWEPYQGNFYTVPLPSPLYSLPDGTCDTLEKKEGKWGVIRRVGQALCNGTTLKCGWVSSAPGDVFQFNVYPPNSVFSSQNNGYSTRFHFSKSYTDGEATMNTSGSIGFRINKTRTNGTASIAAVDTWLQSNNIFALHSRTEAFEVLTDATQAILNSIATIAGDNIIHNSDGADMNVTLAGVAVPASRTVNGKTLTEDIVLTPADLGMVVGSGTWVPKFLNGTFTYTKQAGYWTRIGNMVFIKVEIRTSAASGYSAGLLVTLPFAAGGEYVDGAAGYSFFAGILSVASAYANHEKAFRLTNGGQVVGCMLDFGNTGELSTITTQYPSGTGTVQFSGWYPIA